MKLCPEQCMGSD